MTRAMRAGTRDSAATHIIMNRISYEKRNTTSNTDKYGILGILSTKEKRRATTCGGGGGHTNSACERGGGEKPQATLWRDKSIFPGGEGGIEEDKRVREGRMGGEGMGRGGGPSQELCRFGPS